jgi:hypothetical protein
MDAWFYDEDQWPSGFAGGLVPLKNEAFRARSLLRVKKDQAVAAPDTVLFEDAAITMSATWIRSATRGSTAPRGWT